MRRGGRRDGGASNSPRKKLWLNDIYVEVVVLLKFDFDKSLNRGTKGAQRYHAILQLSFAMLLCTTYKSHPRRKKIEEINRLLYLNLPEYHTSFLPAT